MMSYKHNDRKTIRTANLFFLVCFVGFLTAQSTSKELLKGHRRATKLRLKSIALPANGTNWNPQTNVWKIQMKWNTRQFIKHFILLFATCIGIHFSQQQRYGDSDEGKRVREMGNDLCEATAKFTRVNNGRCNSVKLDNC